MNLDDIKRLRDNTRHHRLEDAEYRRLFLDPRTGMARHELLRPRSCPVCASRTNRRLFIKQGLRFVRCRRCAMVFINPYFRAQHKERYYKASRGLDRFFREIVLKTRPKRMALIWQDRAAWIRRHVLGGHVLDIGCGSGEFLETLGSRGYRSLLGIEPNRVAARFAASRLPGRIVNAVLKDVDLAEGRYSLVTLWEVLGHFDEPRDVCAKIHRAMKKGGVLVVSSPNFDGFEYQALGPWHNDVTFKLPNYFTRPTLLRLLEDAGFRAIETSTPGRLDLQHVQRNVLLMPAKIRLDPFIRSIVMDAGAMGGRMQADFQDFLRKHQLSGSMLVAARKA